MKKIRLLEDRNESLNELYQSIQIRFCLATETPTNYIRSTPFFLCRDYLCDQVVCALSGTDIGPSYGVTARVGDLDLSKKQVLLLSSACQLSPHFLYGLGKLAEMEVSFGWEPTKLLESSKSGQKHALSFDQRYIKSTVMFSLLTHFIRAIEMCPVEDEDTFQEFLSNAPFEDRVEEYQDQIRKRIDFKVLYTKNDEIFSIEEPLKKIIKEFHSLGEKDIEYIHSETGIVSFCNTVYYLCRGHTPFCYGSSELFDPIIREPAQRYFNLAYEL